MYGCVTPKDFYDRMERGEYSAIGNSDCALYITRFTERYPEAPVLIIERPIKDVVQSLKKQNIPAGGLARCASALNKLQGLRVGFDEIDHRLEEIHKYLGIAFDSERAQKYINTNIQLYSFDYCPNVVAKSVSCWGL